jgi:ZIP family zinc transporter
MKSLREELFVVNWFFGLSPVLQGLAATLFTYFITALGAGVVFFFKAMNQKAMDMMMGFAAGVMIAASFWSLLAPAIELSAALGGNAWLTSAVGFMLGGFFVIGSDVVLSKAMVIKDGGALKRSILLTSAVTLHNIPEGLAVGVAFGSAAIGINGASVSAAAMLALGIGLQNFPEGVCVAMPLRRDGASRLKSFFFGQASGFVEPVAGVLGVLFALTVRSALPLALSFSAGAMIAVVCSELIPESFRDNKTIAAFGVLFGFATMMILDVALG